MNIPGGLKGTKQRARRMRGVVMALGVWMLLAGAVLGFLVPKLWAMGVVMVGLGLAAIGLSVAARPIAKVTFRAWLAGRMYGRVARRNAVNASGNRTARARRSAANKAAWAAQRARDGRAAASVGRLSPNVDEVDRWRKRRKRELDAG